MQNTLSCSLLEFCRPTNTTNLETFLTQCTATEHLFVSQNCQLLQASLNQLPHLAGHIFVNFAVPNSDQFVSSVILYRGLIFVVSIDHQSSEHSPTLIEQTHHFARQFKQHHESSKDKFIIPVVLTPNAQPQGGAIHVSEDLVANTMCDTGDHLAALIEHFSNQYKDDEILADEWV